MRRIDTLVANGVVNVLQGDQQLFSEAVRRALLFGHGFVGHAGLKLQKIDDFVEVSFRQTPTNEASAPVHQGLEPLVRPVDVGFPLFPTGSVFQLVC